MAWSNQNRFPYIYGRLVRPISVFIPAILPSNLPGLSGAPARHVLPTPPQSSFFTKVFRFSRKARKVQLSTYTLSCVTRHSAAVHSLRARTGTTLSLRPTTFPPPLSELCTMCMPWTNFPSSLSQLLKGELVNSFLWLALPEELPVSIAQPTGGNIFGMRCSPSSRRESTGVV